nr:hypothetical protein [Tanacetum cinerariifolium]
MQTQTSNTLHNAIMEAGGKDRLPMLALSNYIQWKSKIKRYIDTKPSHELIHYCLKNPPYKFTWADKEVPISEGIDNDIYSTVDASSNACEMWKAIERLKQGESINVQDLKTNLYWEFRKFTSRDGELLKSYYSRFYKMMNELSQELKIISYHKLHDILKQHQNEVNEIRAERIARTANPLALNSSTRSQQDATRNRGKAIVNSHPPIYDQEPSVVAEDDEIGVGYDNQRSCNVVGAKETVGTTVVQKSRIQCYNCKEFRHVARECHKPKRENDAAYHREKMLLCKQEEAGIQLNTEQADWRDDTDDESEDQELEAHYMYMAQIQAVSPDAVDSGPIFDVELLKKVSNDDHYNVFAVESDHPEQSKSVNDTYPIKKDEHNVIIDSLDMSYDREHIYHNDDDDDLANEREIEEFKTQNKSLESSSNRFEEANNKLSETNALTYKDLKKFQAELDRRNDVDQPVQTMNMLNNKCRTGFAKPEFLKKAQRANPRLYDIEEMVVDLRYFNPLKLEVDSLKSQLETQKTWFLNEIDRLSREYYYADQMNAILGVIPTTSVSRPHLKRNPMKDRVMLNNSQGKKHEVEDHHRNVKFSKNKTSVTACNDSLKAMTSNVNFVCATCGKCVLNEKHDMCVLKSVNGVNSRTKMPIVVPVSTREPKRTVEQSVAKPLRKTVALETSNQKPRNIFRKLYERISCWWYPKFTPSGYTRKPKYEIGNVNQNLVEIVLFIVDSGCSKHMTGNLKLLINFVEKFMGTVKVGNDQIIHILGYGDLVQGDVTIKRVYYVEGLNYNLFSVGQFCDADLEVAFRKLTCYIRDLKGNGLLTAWLWHRRLSYLNFDTINLLSKNDIVVGLPKIKSVKDHRCSSCELGKAKRKSFQSMTTSSTKRRLQLLHMDVCGPMRVASINGKKYVLVIVDDYSRYTWTHFLRSKDETPEVLIDFLRLVPKRTSCSRILHQTSVARTPKQNGVVERRNHTLIEAARTILSAAKVPLFFWAEAIATTCFTQNRSLSFVESTADAPNQRQQQHTTPLNNQTTTDPSCQVPTQAITFASTENINLAETIEENAQVKNDEFINIFCTPVQDRRETSSLIRTEPNNIKESMTNSAWIELMHEELHQFDRLDVWESVNRPHCKNVINMKWLWKNKSDEENT